MMGCGREDPNEAIVSKDVQSLKSDPSLPGTWSDRVRQLLMEGRLHRRERCDSHAKGAPVIVPPTVYAGARACCRPAPLQRGLLR